MAYSKDPKSDIEKDKPDALRFVAHRVRELGTLSSHLFVRRRPRLIAFPSTSWNTASGLLWGKGAMAQMRSLGWDIVLVPPQLEHTQRQRLCRILKPDAVLCIKARTWKNHPKHFAQYPFIFLLDDADFLDPQETDHIIECIKAASLVIAANEYVANWCRQYSTYVEKIWVPHPPRAAPPKTTNASRDRIVMWAPADPESYPIESRFVAEVICKLRSSRDDFEFWMTGCKDQGWAKQFAKPMLDSGVKLKQFGYFKAFDDYLDTIAQTAVGLHPVKLENPYAQGKSFGKILSYIVSSTAVITDPVPDHADFINHQSNGMLASSIDEYVQSISYLLDHPDQRSSMTDRAYTDFLAQLATPVAAQRLDHIIRKAIQ